MRIIDTKGLVCPAPLIAAKRALRESAPGESFTLLTDNKTSYENLSRFLTDNKAGFKVSASEGVWTFIVTLVISGDNMTRPEEYCGNLVAHFSKGDFIVVISSDKMGEGDDTLGKLLITNFIRALMDIDKLPQKIIFYNSGVKLAVKTSPVIGNLRDMEKMGVEIILCSTCINHYSLQEECGIGTISNMFTITEIMSSARHIVKP